MRWPSCSGARGAVIRSLVEAFLDPLYRNQFTRDALLAFDPDQLNQAEPVQPAGKPGDLAVMAERGIDEARRTDKGAHARHLQRRQMLLP